MHHHKQKMFVSGVFLLALLLSSPANVVFGAVSGVSLQASFKEVEIDTIEKGHEFLVLVKIQPTQGLVDTLYGASLDVVYDPQHLEIFDVNPVTPKINPKVSEGDMLNEGGITDTFLMSALVNNQPGRLTVGLTRKGPVEGVSIDQGGVLLSVYFKAIAATTQGTPTKINLSLAGLRDKDNVPLEVTGLEGDELDVLALVVAKLDLNDDDVIDLKDLILAMQVQTAQPPTQPVLLQADFSGDGIIGLAEALGIIQVVAGLRNPPSN